MDVAIVAAYLVAMIAFGFWGKRRARTEADFLVAGRRLGPLLYAGTMSALVLGGASTIGGVGLGYEYGLSGMWLVVAIGAGVLLLSLLFAGRVQRLGVYTVSQMLELRYGLKGEHPRTLEEVGRAFGVTRERIRQIENNTLKKLESLPEAQGLMDCV